MVRLIAVDIDGTLLDSRGRVPEAHRDALADAAARGIAVALVTGRSFLFSRPIAAMLPFPLTLVVNNGALVKDRDGATLDRHLLPRATARVILERTRTYEDSVAVVFDRPDERHLVFERMDWTHPKRQAYYEKNKAYASRTQPLAGALTEDPVQVMFNGHLAPMRALIAELRDLADVEAFSISTTEYEARDFAMVDVNGAGCSKGATLARWAAARGIEPEEILAAGDNLNDVEMLEFAGTAVVMGNASPAVKARVNGAYITGTNDEGGLADAVHRFALEPASRPYSR
jgi:Cof subfamily protein (haloacid dehalogenase superfamily)